MLNINPVPRTYEDTLTLLADDFGGRDYLPLYFSTKDLQTILTFGGFICIVKPWASTVDLAEYGFSNLSSYSIYNKDWQFLYEVREDHTFYGKSDKDLELLWKAYNGEYFFINFRTGTAPVTGILICNNQMPSEREKYWIKGWVAASEVNAWRPQYHEVLFQQTTLLNGGYIRIHFIGGNFTDRPTLEDFYYYAPDPDETIQERGLRENVEILDVPVENLVNWYPRVSGWYLFRHLYAYLMPAEGTNRTSMLCKDLTCSLERRPGDSVGDVNIPLVFTGVTGVGVRRLRYLQDGIFYLDLKGDNLAPAYASSTVFGIAGAEHSFDTSPWMRIESGLSYLISGVITDIETAIADPLNNNSITAIDVDNVYADMRRLISLPGGAPDNGIKGTATDSYSVGGNTYDRATLSLI